MDKQIQPTRTPSEREIEAADIRAALDKFHEQIDAATDPEERAKLMEERQELIDYAGNFAAAEWLGDEID